MGAGTNILLDAMFISGLGLGVQGAQPLLSYNLGAGQLDRVKQTFRLLLAACVSGSYPWSG